MEDLRTRLVYAANTLDDMAKVANNSTTMVRMTGKAQGVRLAISYLDETMLLEKM